MLNFQKCPISGQWVAQGEKAQYWIDDSVLTNMRTVVVTSHGPVITKWVPHHDVDSAKAEAEIMEALVTCFSCDAEFAAERQKFCNSCIG